MSLDLSSKSYLITGGATGLGFACARALLADGANVTICGRTESALVDAFERLKKETGCGARLNWIAGDVTVDDDVKSIAAKAAEHTGQLDGCVANAGGGGVPGYMHKQDAAEFQRVLLLNIMGTQLCLKHTIPLMQKAGGGSFVAMSSLAGDERQAYSYMGAYGVSKAGVDQMMRAAAREYGKDNIRCNSIRPGFIQTEINNTYMPEGSDITQSYADNVMLGGPLGQPEDIGYLARFLLGPESRWMTGQTLSVDGGQSLMAGPDNKLMMDALGIE